MVDTVVMETSLANIPVHRGKVRDIYDLGERLLLVSTDRISAFDWVLPTGIPDKGRVLTCLSAFWFRRLGAKHHMLSVDPREADLPQGVDYDLLEGRSMIVRKADVVPIECVARGYLSGSGWKEYTRQGTVCDIELPKGLIQAAELAEPIFTPATKEQSGHDVNISLAQMSEMIGRHLADELRERTLDLYRKAAEFARGRGIILADTKLEWGRIGDELILIDEVFTPDSSRFWPADRYEPGCDPPSFDKQFVRNWLETTSWDKNSPPPPLPDEVVEQTRQKYVEAYERLTGESFPWK